MRLDSREVRVLCLVDEWARQRGLTVHAWEEDLVRGGWVCWRCGVRVSPTDARAAGRALPVVVAATYEVVADPRLPAHYAVGEIRRGCRGGA